jgi:hypothetical protein
VTTAERGGLAGSGGGAAAAKVVGVGKVRGPGELLLAFTRFSLLGVTGAAFGTAAGDAVRLRFFPDGFVSVMDGGVSP